MMFPKAPASIYQSSKCFVTHGSMGHIDPKQVPHKSKPWANLAQFGFIHKVDVLLPQEVSEKMRQELIENRPAPSYQKLVMSLGQMLERDFFREIIKKGDTLMLSEGKTSVDNMFTFIRGTLTMYLDNETYERAGLVGQPYGAKGNRGIKPRWVVKCDLWSASMRHGKKAFDKLVYAAEQVLNKPLTWLLCNAEESASTIEPLQKHHPAKFTTSPDNVEGIEVGSVPMEISSQVLADGDRSGLEIETHELYEWLSLVRLESPRIEAGDRVDPYLSRYESPQAPTSSMQLVRLSWQGFISPQWLRETLVLLLKACPAKTWFALSASEFSCNVADSSNEVLLLRPPQSAGKYVMWEIKAHE